MPIKIVSSSKSEERPISASYITELLQDASTVDSKALIKFILENVSKKSSKHKFLVQVTKISSSSDGDCNAGTSFGAVWDNEKDGYFCFEIESKSAVSEEDQGQNEDTRKSVLFSIYWVYIN